MAGETLQAEPSGNVRGLVVMALVLAAAVFWSQRGGAGDDADKQIAGYADLCPRWVQLAQDLLTIDGEVPRRCEYIETTSAVLSTPNHVYRADPSIEVRVVAASDDATVPQSVVIRDTKSQASVTYNAEALALLK